MSGFAEGYFIIFGGLAVFGAVAAVYFYLQDRKEAQAEEIIASEVENVPSKRSTPQEPTNGNWSRATAYFEKSLALSEAIGDLPGRALVLRNLGKLCAKQGEINKAKDWFEKALAIYEELGDKLSMARVYNELGLLFSHSFAAEDNPAEKIEN
ncbi:MAG: tetratricopeptide repeat protein [candidate division KSB1 bacterium]|nr:tetratricopeptide repeat protein [candidate division KSB1 bacterium]MDZ7367042.1 tetratricopeptide repeat protein [candidate division KSB1 bacterium]MDZ7406742.1 tetratricopeptide repeat protein [candidate division KSB1 bacterium]